MMNNTKTTPTPTSLRTMTIVWMALYGCLALTVVDFARAFQQNSPMRSRLSVRMQYRDDATNDQSASPSQQQQRWWSSFTSSAASTKSKPEPISQQEKVDEYLEFLDKRYKKIHQQEERHLKQEEKRQQQTPFSAMEWLYGGGSSQTAQSQEEDALYALGVAGLASERLLQKHHIPTSEPAMEPSPSSTDSTRSNDDDVIEVTAERDDDESSSLQVEEQVATPSHVVIKKVLVPMIRAIYIVQRRKDLILNKIQTALGAVASRAARKVTRPVASRLRKGPRGVLDAMLELGGGKHNIVFTLACAYTTVLILRPILQAAVAEATVGP